MDFDDEFRTVLRDCPGLKAKFLVERVMEATGLGRSTVWDHLTSAVIRNVVFRSVRPKGHYYLEPPEGAERRARERHTKEIIAGLLVLVGSGKYTASGGIVPDPSLTEYARQHLESGYSSISALKSARENALFVKRVTKLIESLKLGDEKLKGYCENCKKRI